MAKTVSTASFTMFDQPQYADYRTETGATERVAMIGSDVSRTVYSTNVVLIRRPDGSERVTTEAWLAVA